MRQALAQYRIVGVQNNVEFLARLVATPAFAEADLDTGLIEREQALLFPPAGRVPDKVWLVAAIAELLREAAVAERRAAAAGDPHSPWRRVDGWRLNGQSRRTLALRHEDTVQEIGVEVVAGGYRLWLADEAVRAQGQLGSDGEIQFQIGERRGRAAVVVAAERRHVFFAGRAWPLALVERLHVGGEGDDTEGGLKAPMPGKVIALLATPGAVVAKGAGLLVLEAMKMEHTLHAPRAGVVKGFRVVPGDQVSDGDELLDFEASPAH
jgi:3-methylcrotonyl-CoA carboxylase alpha subunit